MNAVEIPECAKGDWLVQKFTVDRPDFHDLIRGRRVEVGATYTRLLRKGCLVMSDTPAEMRDHRAPVYAARGHCLLNGLGLGMVLKNILPKPEVESVTVIEISQDLIDLIGPHYSDPRVKIICADAMTFFPPKGIRYGMVWHDIWDNICADNLPDMEKLHRKYARRCDWQGSWAKELCKRCIW